MTHKTFCFIGNRTPTLWKLLQQHPVDIYVPKDSFADQELKATDQPYTQILNKKHLLECLNKTTANTLISNGCPYILPISTLKKSTHIQNFYNIHPSLLPALKGPHPINGAIWHNIPAGATLHEMTDEIDAGTIIQQVITTQKVNINANVLYPLVFETEARCLEEALTKNFQPQTELPLQFKEFYYTRGEEQYISYKKDSLSEMDRKIKAFHAPGQYARLNYQEKEYQITHMTHLPEDLLTFFPEGISTHNSYLILRKDNMLCQLSYI